METHITPDIRDTADGQLAESILRSCVHCGFCNATCPTYQIIGDENDGPRGRIYLIKQLLEGKECTEKTQLHLDRCLTCRNCETTCPSGVNYSKLLDIGRKIAEENFPRSTKELKKRRLLRTTLTSPKTFNRLLKSGQLFKVFLPKNLREKVPEKRKALKYPSRVHQRKMIILNGCVQPSISPDINSATAIVLDKLGISVISHTEVSCCGAVSQHLSAEEEALSTMKRNIDIWWSDISSGVEAIISTASGCGVMLKEYAHYLRNDPDYVSKAELISKLSKDISEILIDEDMQSLHSKQHYTLAWHPPCTLQHGQKITGKVEAILTHAGHTLVPVKDSHLCCGSAGTYSILQPVISGRLREDKLENLLENAPEMIVTANIGCQTHIQQGCKIPVVHWITLFT